MACLVLVYGQILKAVKVHKGDKLLQPEHTARNTGSRRTFGTRFTASSKGLQVQWLWNIHGLNGPDFQYSQMYLRKAFVKSLRPNGYTHVFW